MSNLFHDAGTLWNGRQKVMLATTVYDTPAAAYVFSLQKSREAIHKAGINTSYLMLQGNCSVDDARNIVVQHFLLSDCTDLVFLDADVSWEPESLIKLCQCDKDLVGGIYPYRREGAESMPVLLVPGIDPEEDGLIQVAGLPTGFMKIKRSVIERLCETADHFWNKSDRRSMVPILFERTFEDGVRWGGDITFCRKWHKAGGKMYAMPDLRLGHTGTITLTDSLSASLRRTNHETIKYMVDQIRAMDTENVHPSDLNVFTEARQYLGNNYGALEDVLSLCAVMGKKADGPILEAGSGLTSIVLAASTKYKVYSLESEPYWAEQTRKMAREAGITNLRVVDCKIVDGWYDINPEYLPKFALGLCDGPRRTEGDRNLFFERFGDIPTIIVDDTDNVKVKETLNQWCNANAREINYLDRSALIRRKAA